MIGEIIPLHLRAVLSSASLKRLLHKWTQCTVCCHIIRRSPVELASHCLRALNYFPYSFSLKKAKGGKEGGGRMWLQHQQGHCSVSGWRLQRYFLYGAKMCCGNTAHVWQTKELLPLHSFHLSKRNSASEVRVLFVFFPANRRDVEEGTRLVPN